VRSHEPSSATYGCDSKGDRYRCGPGPTDVRQLARIWGWKAHVIKTTGYCKYSPPAAELTSDDPAEMTLPFEPQQQRQIPFYVRNMSQTPWIIDLLAVPVDENGAYRDNGCIESDGPFVGSEIENEKDVLPGQVANFIVFVCADPGQTKAFHFRLASKWFSPKPFVFGPVWTVAVHFPAA
jgi:hypothetical protein